MKGCKKQQIKYSSYCKEHASKLKSQVAGHTLGRVLGKFAGPTVLTALCAAVAAKYQDEGDMTRAGVVVSCLAHDPPRYYASVARYENGPYQKHVVCGVGEQGDAPIPTAEEAILILAQKWAERNRPAPVLGTMEDLDAVLGVVKP